MAHRKEGGRREDEKDEGGWNEDWTCVACLLLMPTASARSEGNTV